VERFRGETNHGNLLTLHGKSPAGGAEEMKTPGTNIEQLSDVHQILTMKAPESVAVLSVHSAWTRPSPVVE
jgi:hypothetical protein